jgi:hypothetical protein
VLNRPIKAGKWHLIGDGIIFDRCDVRFDLVWRAQDGDHEIGSVTHHFDPQPDGSFNAVPFESDVAGVAVNPLINRDQLVLRFSTQSPSAQSVVYVPNGDGYKTKGRIPALAYPR